MIDLVGYKTNDANLQPLLNKVALVLIRMFREEPQTTKGLTSTACIASQVLTCYVCSSVMLQQQSTVNLFSTVVSLAMKPSTGHTSQGEGSIGGINNSNRAGRGGGGGGYMFG